MQPRGSTPDIVSRIQKIPAFERCLQKLQPGEVFTLPIPECAHACWITALHRSLPERPLVVVCETTKTQESLHSELLTWHQGLENLKPRTVHPPHFFPEWEILAHEDKLPHADVVSERLETLIRLQTAHASRTQATAPLVVTSALAALQRTFSVADLTSRLRQYKVGDQVNPLDLIEWLEDQGYEPEVQVHHKGEIAWRGGILDVWPLSSPVPIRIEFFGDQIESMRGFDPHHQTSQETIEHVVLPPAGELGLMRQAWRRALSESSPSSASGDDDTPPAISQLAFGSLLDHLAGWPVPPVLVLLGPISLQERADRYRESLPPDDPFVLSWKAWLDSGERLQATWHDVEPESWTTDTNPASTGTLASTHSNAEGPRFVSLEAYRPLGISMPETGTAEALRREFFHQMHRWLRQDQQVEVICQTEGEQQRFHELWSEYDLPDPCPGTRLGTLMQGFHLLDAGIVLVSDAEIYGRRKVQRARRLKSRHATTARSGFEVDFTAFEEGDFVVHLEHGIGVFRGIQPLPSTPTRSGSERSGGLQECLVIEYAPSQPGAAPPRLYIPLQEAHLVSKYVGAGKARPQLSNPGSRKWQRAKDHAQKAVRDLAAELLAVQAARTSQPGYACPPDTPWQREFEAAFEYEETGDQLQAIQAVKQDLETARPMDRLLCGDVGFGKTEVAIRAAFKCVMSGKQVAILVPTTVLAQQHYNTFRERMAEFPVRVELLSRFRTTAQQRAVLEAAQDGSVDIIIGTHRLVSGDVQFRDLGLVIVDEEQRFGVKHKEEFKLLRQTVDVLTLSATPIPRTLYMALTGARDLSTLETPPQDRLPVETIVSDYDERLIRDAIERELNRGGQVYFLHNRVTTIESVALKLRDLVPQARIVVGHGQMPEKDLERIMLRFVNGEADVLVSTTIIESGLDIPNANTILIDRADRFGLSELYQLRGRVGRYKHQAYAYLLLPRHARLLTEARKRMSAIKQYSALGSGFKIALRDLEIRGAGNILGAQQSGHITAVGFDLYCQLLGQSVAALKGEEKAPRIHVRVQLDFLMHHPGEETPSKTTPKPKPNRIAPIEVPRDGDIESFDDWTVPTRSRFKQPQKPEPPSTQERAPAYLPLDYVREPSHRVELYRRLAQVTSKKELQDLLHEIRDRFGLLPPAVDVLGEVTELRLLAASRQITSVEVVDAKIKLVRNGDLITVGGQFPRLKKTEPRARLRELKASIQAIAPISPSAHLLTNRALPKSPKADTDR